MKVRLLRNPAACIGCRLRENESGDVDDVIGKTLLSLGLAVRLDEPAPVAAAQEAIQAVPEPPTIAEPAEPAIKVSKKQPWKQSKAAFTQQPPNVKEESDGRSIGDE
jgi:hypothetical protein